jgi:hypothetical protein
MPQRRPPLPYLHQQTNRIGIQGKNRFFGNLLATETEDKGLEYSARSEHDAVHEGHGFASNFSATTFADCTPPGSGMDMPPLPTT